MLNDNQYHGAKNSHYTQLRKYLTTFRAETINKTWTRCLTNIGT